MGNRAVITTTKDYQRNGLGVYLHWNGGRDSVEAFLQYCKLKGYRAPDTDGYGWARLCQVIGNFFGGGLSIGIDTISRLDCDNWDNGVYIIEGWDIVRRDYFSGFEQNEYNRAEMLEAIDAAQPKTEQLGKEVVEGIIRNERKAQPGDRVAMLDELSGTWGTYKVLGVGNSDRVNGSDVCGVPFVDKYGESTETARKNINNYLLDRRQFVRL